MGRYRSIVRQSREVVLHDHEGYVAKVFDDGSVVGGGGDEVDEHTVGFRAACGCGWQGATVLGREPGQFAFLDFADLPRLEAEWTAHTDEVIATSVASFWEADRFSPFELARMFADVPRLRRDDPSTVLHELAVEAVLSKRLAGWVGLDIHRALRAGVPLDAVSDACGQDRACVQDPWRAWADGQLARGLLERSEYEQVVARFRVAARHEESER